MPKEQDGHVGREHEWDALAVLHLMLALLSFETNVFGSNKIVTIVLSEVLLVMVLTSPGPFPPMMCPWS